MPTPWPQPEPSKVKVFSWAVSWNRYPDDGYQR